MSEATRVEARTARPATWAVTPISYLHVGAQRLAYRDLGPLGGTPLVALTHLGATLNEWDPSVIDALAKSRRVVVLELAGVGSSSGRVPLTVAEMARTARKFIAAIGLERIHLFGFSLGGFIAQQVALDAPELVTKLILTGTVPAGGKGIARRTGGAYVYRDALRAVLARTDAKRYLFFPRTTRGNAAADAYLARISARTIDRDKPMSLRSFHRQIRAISAWGKQPPHDLGQIQAPTLIANGDHDKMVPTALSRDMAERIPNSTLVIYPDAGHGGIFQFHDEFTRAAIEHLDAPEG